MTQLEKVDASFNKISSLEGMRVSYVEPKSCVLIFNLTKIDSSCLSFQLDF